MIVGDLESDYARGTHVVNGNPLCVSNGLGVFGAPFRFLALPSIAIFELARGEGASDGEPSPEEVFEEMAAGESQRMASPTGAFDRLPHLNVSSD